MVVYEALNLGDYKRRLRAEFGFDDTAEFNRLITDKVNQAISTIVRRKGNFPWQRREMSIDLPLGTSGTGSFTQGSRIVTTVSALATDKRRVLTPSNTGQTHGYLLTSASTSELTLQSQWRGVTEAALSFRIANAFAELPINVMKVDVSTKLTTFGLDSFLYCKPRDFEIIKHRENFVSSLENIFTVVPDPLAETGKYYLAIYPYLSSLNTLRGYFFTVPPKLENDPDEPIIPPNDREVIFNLACFYLAGSRTDASRLSYYDRLASEGMERMAQEYQLYESYATDDHEFYGDGSVVGPDYYRDPYNGQDFYPNGVLIP